MSRAPLKASAEVWGQTYSSVVSFFRPSHSFSFLCRTPFCVSHLKQQSTAAVTFHAERPVRLRAAAPGTYMRYWSRVLRSWIRSGLMLFIFLSISR